MRVTARARSAAIDTGFLSALLVLGLVGFRTTYSGDGFLLAGLLAILLGCAVGQVCVALRQPVLAVTALTLLTFFAAGPPAVLRAAPDWAALHALAGGAVHGWKDLLTTLPPVGSGGPLLVVPFLLLLAGAVVGTVVAMRTSAAALVLLAPGAVLAAVLLLGTATAPARLLQGNVFGCCALAWVAVRHRRNHPVATSGRRSLPRAAAALGMLVVAGLAAVPLAPALPFAHANDRVVLRRYVTPPFEVGRYPSPLAAYRRFMTVDRTQPLFAVDLPAGSLVRVATLDTYDGNVWGAGSDGPDDQATGDPGFQRVGDVISTSARGVARIVHVRIAAAWAASTNDVWLPVTGVVTGVHLTRPAEAAAFRYDLTTDTGVVPDGLGAGEAVSVHVIVPPTSGNAAHLQGYGQPLVTAAQTTFLRGEIESLLKAPCSPGPASAGVDPMATVQAVERAFLSCGALSHGEGGDQSQYEPGHSVHRLSEMISQPQLVGDDEQYAALLALLANQTGVPARVVVGAAVPPGGVVHGADMHAWVELHVADGVWQTVPSGDFVPTRQPSKQPPPQIDQQNPPPVPPPATSRLPSSDEQPDLASGDGHSHPSANHHGSWHVPTAVIRVLTYGGPPVLLGCLVCAALVLAKARRRDRRRSRGSATSRLAGAWAELLDHTRDLGLRPVRDGTRREQARSLEALDVGRLAQSADQGVFGPGEPADDQVRDYWDRVELFRRATVSELSRWRRWRTALSPASLRASGLQGVP